MVGGRIRELRESRKISRLALANRVGIETELLEYIETWNIRHVGRETLIRIADTLGAKASTEFAELLALNSRLTPKLRVFRVGPLSAGSTTLYRLFSRYHALHECFPAGILNRLAAVRRDEVGESALADYLLERDEVLGHPELVSSFETLLIAPLLGRLFPDARFILTVREVYSWLDHTVRWLMWHHSQFGPMTFVLLPDLAVTTGPEEDLHRDGPRLVTELLRYWASSWNLMIGGCPPDRSLVLRTHEILDRHAEIAGFLGLPVDTMDTARAQQFSTFPASPALDRAWHDWIPALISDQCTNLMKEVFPEFSLEHFLRSKRSAK